MQRQTDCGGRGPREAPAVLLGSSLQFNFLLKNTTPAIEDKLGHVETLYVSAIPSVSSQQQAQCRN